VIFLCFCRQWQPLSYDGRQRHILSFTPSTVRDTNCWRCRQFLVHWLSCWLAFSYFMITSRWTTLLGSRYTVVIPRLVLRPSAQRKTPCCGPVKHLGHTKLTVPPQHLYLSGTVSQGIFYLLPLLPSLDHCATFCGQ
jgi:hypothetical protein